MSAFLPQIPSIDKETKNAPLVLVHGFGCGGGIFAPSLDALSENRDVYAIDMLGFALSSRPRLSSDAMEAEKEVVDGESSSMPSTKEDLT